MLNWDKKFLEKLKTLGIEHLLYSRLKDDILISTFCLERGSKYLNGKIRIDATKENEDENKNKNKSDSKITMEVLNYIANSVDPMPTFNFDTP